MYLNVTKWICFAEFYIFVFSFIASVFGILAVVGTILDYVSSCTPEKITVSKTNSFMPAQYSREDPIQNLPVNENQPFLAHNDVKKSHCKFCYNLAFYVNSILYNVLA